MSGAVWTVRDGTDIIQVPARGMPFQVAARDLDRAQPISQLRLSRDGSRVALLAGSAGNQVLYVGAISAAGSAVTELRSIVPELTDVRDVSWTSADELMVLSGSADKTATIYTVGVDGSLSQAITSYGLPTPPTAVAAAPRQAMLAVAAGHIWRLGDAGSAWMAVPPQPSGLADSAPAYPD
jgi:WD40 repeat protein